MAFGNEILSADEGGPARAQLVPRHSKGAYALGSTKVPLACKPPN